MCNAEFTNSESIYTGWPPVDGLGHLAFWINGDGGIDGGGPVSDALTLAVFYGVRSWFSVSVEPDDGSTPMELKAKAVAIAKAVEKNTGI